MADGIATTTLASSPVSDRPTDTWGCGPAPGGPHDELLHAKMAAIERSHTLLGFRLDGTILYLNERMVDVLGYPREVLVGRGTDMLLPPETIDSAAYRERWAAMRAGQYFEREISLIRVDGTAIWLRSTYHPVLDAEGRVDHVIACGSVITEEVLLRRDREAQIEAIDKSQCVASFAFDGTILSANDRFCALFGYEPDELIGRNHAMLRDAGQVGTLDYARHWETLRNGQSCAGLFRCLGKAGQEIWLQATYCPLIDAAGTPTRIVKYATDVTSNVTLASAFEDAQRRSQHDTATGLPNRARLISFMEAVAEKGCGMVVLYLDLDRFKPINDSLGHHAGDHVLAVIADRLRRLLSYDQLAARIGGDEFVIVAPDMSADAVEAACQRVIDEVREPIRFEGVEIGVGVSIGIAMSPGDASTPDELLRCADIALYRAKQARGQRFVFYSNATNDRLLSYQEQVDALRAGLVGQQFVLEFQPRYGAASRTIHSVEALVRWNHPSRGRVPPGDFIPIAERSGLIVPLGEWVLREACRHVIGWPGIGVSVNLSPVQIRDSDVIALVRDVLDQTGLDPTRLELEITEGTLFSDAARARETLLGLKALGVRIAMDDFGVGYSSLGSLRSFPFDVLKIDKQFIDAIDIGSAGREIVRAILTIARALDLSVTAEGVETNNQLSLLVDDGCAEVQGFLLSRPVPPGRISAMLERQVKRWRASGGAGAGIAAHAPRLTAHAAVGMGCAAQNSS
ncbi:diguanylate cyclase (GGDEF)-like protein/PAS domain S-box-containing protein [Endobacter medicaginis]|uniref:Diguanylate cyclase (GGDEF)-like protein/PAS domain S-box-containing protein n=1 Tax=Endobacter medicaginis TaxID=1181271 RepID=A0A839UTM6_9PROT|nr:bifunctional diguanylate cyclase/phosphodiesterase [Endobacter medicaginis]MBB3173147.1 diguanylate cyclase (GGDEF)-like protein/PAS domain S-box-containing protein [Endobacter medicaginis]MCX5476089.1 EAL domain-containing protein [Endobacter medicaginis]NVN30463.1 EAL domain-containing protein [Endobacter medicaginis]